MNKKLSPEQKLSSTLDRLNEAHFWLHTMENNYHYADHFRWSFNTFLRSLKEIPSILNMEIQNEKEIKDQYKQARTKLTSDPLMEVLSKKRNFIVHKAMFIPKSSGEIGLTNLREIRFGIRTKIDPLLNSDFAILKVVRDGDPFGILEEDEDTIPCVNRVWKLKEFDDDIIEVSAAAWKKTSELVRETLALLGLKVPSNNLECRHSFNKVQQKLFERSTLKQMLKDF